MSWHTATCSTFCWAVSKCGTRHTQGSYSTKVSYKLIVKCVKMITKNEKCIGVFRVTFFVFCVPFFVFRILHQGLSLCEKSKDFVVYFFAALIKQEINLHEIWKCIAGLKVKWSTCVLHCTFIDVFHWQAYFTLSAYLIGKKYDQVW